MIRTATQRPTILLVEDDRSDQHLTRRALAEAGIDVDLLVANDGVEAMDYLLRSNDCFWGDLPVPDVVFLDLNMANMGGGELLRRIRATNAFREIPVVVLTTSEQEEEVLKSYRLGCNSFITKPVGYEEFVSTIRDVGHYWLRVVRLPYARSN